MLLLLLLQRLHVGAASEKGGSVFESLTEELLELTAVAKGASAAYFAETTSCCCCCCCIIPKPL